MKNAKKTKNRNLNENGFTLVEIIITIAIMSIVFLVIFRFMEFNINSYEYGNEMVDESAELRLVALKVTQEVRNCFKVDFTDDASTTTFSKLTSITPISMYATNATSGIVKQPLGSSAISMSNDIIANIQFAAIDYNGKVALKIRLVGTNETMETEVLLNNITVTGDASTDNVDMLSSVLSSSALESDLTWFDRIWFTQNVAYKD